MKEKEILSYVQDMTDETFESMTDLRKALNEPGKLSKDFQNLAMVITCLLEEEK